MIDQHDIRTLYLENLRAPAYYDGKVRPTVWNSNQWANVNEHNHIYSKLSESHPGDIWLWSDHHFNHKNIIPYSERPFQTLQEMENFIVEQNNETVKDNDICIWGGDVGFCAAKITKEILERCKGYKILIVGNHDFNKKKLRQMGFDEVYISKHFCYNGIDFILTHYPMFNLPENMINLHGHVHSGGNSKANNSGVHFNINCEFWNYTPLNIKKICEIIKLNSE